MVLCLLFFYVCFLDNLMNNDWAVQVEGLMWTEICMTDFWATVCKTVRPMLSDRCLSVSVCLSVMLVHCGQTVGWIKIPLGKLVRR